MAVCQCDYTVLSCFESIFGLISVTKNTWPNLKIDWIEKQNIWKHKMKKTLWGNILTPFFSHLLNYRHVLLLSLTSTYLDAREPFINVLCCTLISEGESLSVLLPFSGEPWFLWLRKTAATWLCSRKDSRISLSLSTAGNESTKLVTKRHDLKTKKKKKKKRKKHLYFGEADFCKS